MSKQAGREVPAYLVERLHKGELPPAQAQRLRAELEQLPGGLAAVDAAIAESDRQILAQHPPEQIAAAIGQRSKAVAAPRARPLMWPALSVAVAGACALVLYARTAAGPTDGQMQTVSVDEEHIGLKGMRPHLVVYRKHDGAPQRLTKEDAVRPGDVLQVAYVVPPAKPGQRLYGAIVSVDANKAATLHLPLEGGFASPLETKGETRLPNAYELDASPGYERFVLVVSARPFSTDEVRDALAAGRELPPSLAHFEMTLLKELP